MGIFDKLFKKSTADDIEPGASPKPPAASVPPSIPGEVKCPSCGHAFVPPRVMLVTQAAVQKYGPNPTQCPACKHIWSRK